MKRPALLLLLVTACAHPPSPSASASASASPSASASASASPSSSPFIPVPETLAFDAARFGLTMQAEGWTWKVLRRNVTRFDWSGRPTAGDSEVLYSFFIDKLDETTAKLLPQLVGSAAANLTEGEPCRPFEQPPEIVKMLGVDRVITVCFEPSTFYGKEHRVGVMHGIIHKGALTLAVVLSNDRTAVIPLPKAIGAHGTT